MTILGKALDLLERKNKNFTFYTQAYKNNKQINIYVKTWVQIIPPLPKRILQLTTIQCETVHFRYNSTNSKLQIFRSSHPPLLHAHSAGHNSFVSIPGFRKTNHWFNVTKSPSSPHCCYHHLDHHTICIHQKCNMWQAHSQQLLWYLKSTSFSVSSHIPSLQMESGLRTLVNKPLILPSAEITYFVNERHSCPQQENASTLHTK